MWAGARTSGRAGRWGRGRAAARCAWWRPSCSRWWLTGERKMRMSLLTGRAGGNGARAATARLGVEPPVSPRRRRTPELVVGVLFVVGSILGVLVLVTSGRDRTPVL